jgi:Acyl-CoA dehydrogenase, C-terminal domain
MDCPLEKWFRDAKIYQIFEGTAQVQRLVVSRMQRSFFSERREQEEQTQPALEEAPAAA